jgi:hypothetical protein
MIVVADLLFEILGVVALLSAELRLDELMFRSLDVEAVVSEEAANVLACRKIDPDARELGEVCIEDLHVAVMGLIDLERIIPVVVSLEALMVDYPRAPPC